MAEANNNTNAVLADTTINEILNHTIDLVPFARNYCVNDSRSLKV